MIAQLTEPDLHGMLPKDIDPPKVFALGRPVRQVPTRIESLSRILLDLEGRVLIHRLQIRTLAIWRTD
jgi:hypothetical protein